MKRLFVSLLLAMSLGLSCGLCNKTKKRSWSCIKKIILKNYLQITKNTL